MKNGPLPIREEAHFVWHVLENNRQISEEIPIKVGSCDARQ